MSPLNSDRERGVSWLSSRLSCTAVTFGSYTAAHARGGGRTRAILGSHVRAKLVVLGDDPHVQMRLPPANDRIAWVSR